MHSSGTDRIAADALANKVSGNRLCQSDHRCLRASIHKPVGNASDAGRSRGHVDNAALSSLQHSRKKGATGPIHRLHIQIEGEIPVALCTVENGTVMHKTGAVEQHIDRSSFTSDAAYI